MRSRHLALFILLFSTIAFAADDVLPVRWVILYKNGIGYFEHVGKVRDTQDVEIVFPGSRLNDVLKSLTVIDERQGRVAGISYDTNDPMGHRLEDMPIKVDSTEGLLDFLNRIRGADVEVHSGATSITGKLMSAELRRKQVGEYTVREVIEVVVYNAQGELKTIELGGASSLRLLKRSLADDVSRYLETLDSGNQRDIRRLKIAVTGTGERDLHVSYNSEAPIWKTTYRLVLDGNRKPLLQGWAIVDNTTPTDWTNVELSLVAGAPISFILNLSQPLYGQRPEIPLAGGVQATPQVHQATLEVTAGQSAVSGTVRDPSGGAVANATVGLTDDQTQTLRQTTSDANGRYLLATSPGNYSITASAPGFKNQRVFGVSVAAGRTTAQDFTLQIGTVNETVNVTAETPSIQTESASVAGRGRTLRKSILPVPAPAPPPARIAPAEGGGIGGGTYRMPASGFLPALAQPLAEQFEYRLSQPVTIGRNQSALLPIVHTEIDGEKVSLFNSEGNQRRPRLAIWMKNTSGLTLDGGSFTVNDADAFAGEGLTETINPGERRLLSYAIDLGLEVDSTMETEKERIVRVELSQGVFVFSKQLAEKKTYRIRNNTEKPRVVVVEHAVRAGWEVKGNAQPVESSSGYHRFRVDAAPKTTTQFTVREESPHTMNYAVRSVSNDVLAMWAKDGLVDETLEQKLRQAIAMQAENSAITGKIAAIDTEEEEIGSDQERLRENLGKLGSSKDEQGLRQRYVHQMEQQEDRLAQLRADRATLVKTQQDTERKLDEFIQSLTLDRKLS